MTSRIEVPLAVVQQLVAQQFPEWADLPVGPVDSPGWDNHTFRLGTDLSVRLPSAECYVPQVEKEHQWLPRLAPHLPLPISQPVRMGHPSEDYPWVWSVCRWLNGKTANERPVDDLVALAEALAMFLRALQDADPTGAPTPGPHNFLRGAPPGVYDVETQRALAVLHGQIDVRIAERIWKAGLDALWEGPPVWLHGDLAPSNLLVDDGRLCAVIDFGQLGVGDPACDYAICWTYFDGKARQVFRDVLRIDAGAWARGRAWALWKALITLADEQASPGRRAEEERTLRELMQGI